MNSRAALFTAFVVAVGTACAQQPKAPEGGMSRSQDDEFRTLDRNQDGFISRSELGERSSSAAQFAAADQNGDGRLTREEFRSLQASASPDRSLGSVPPEEAGAAAGAGRASGAR